MRDWLLADFHWLFVTACLVLVIAGCLFAWVRRQDWYWADDEPEDLPGRGAPAPAAGELQIVLPPIEDEPGEEYADELQQIRGELMAEEPRYDSLAIITRIPRYMADRGYTAEDWLRLNLPDGDYWALREAEMKRWQDSHEDDEKRYLRSCVRKGWLVMEELAA